MSLFAIRFASDVNETNDVLLTAVRLNEWFLNSRHSAEDITRPTCETK